MKKKPKHTLFAFILSTIIINLFVGDNTAQALTGAQVDSCSRVCNGATWTSSDQSSQCYSSCRNTGNPSGVTPSHSDPLPPGTTIFYAGGTYSCNADGSGSITTSDSPIPVPIANDPNCVQPTTSQPTQTLPSCPDSNPNCNLQYTPLAPISANEPTTIGTTANFTAVVNAFLEVLIAIGSFIAVVTLTIGGVMYMMSDATGTKTRAVERMKAAIWGLVLLLASVLLLQTIDPKIVQVNLNDLVNLGCSGTNNNC